VYKINRISYIPKKTSAESRRRTKECSVPYVYSHDKFLFCKSEAYFMDTNISKQMSKKNKSNINIHKGRCASDIILHIF